MERQQGLRCAVKAMAAAVLSVLAMASQAQGAFAAKSVHLRAGPGPDFPVVAVLAAGFPLSVQGCLSTYTWCDVIAGPNRGWVYAGNIDYPYQNAYVPVLTYGPVIGIAVLGFAVDDYWGHFYRDRPWFGQRQRFVHRGPPPRFAGPPGPRVGPPRQMHAQPVPRGGRPEQHSAFVGRPRDGGAMREPGNRPGQGRERR